MCQWVRSRRYCIFCRGSDALRVAAYEFTYTPDALKSAVDRGVDVSIIYEACKKTVKGERVDPVHG
jgi:hypothetical protein